MVEGRTFLDRDVAEVDTYGGRFANEDFGSHTNIEPEVIVTFTHVVTSTTSCKYVKMQNLFREDTEFTVDGAQRRLPPKCVCKGQDRGSE
jgi:hypothetical protein